MALTAGTTLGPYEILSPIGAGGMGEVYRARDTRLDRTVAIKVLPGHLTADPDARQRFEREARAVSALNHPHICVLYDIGQQDGVDFIVMEHLAGETLADRLKKAPLPLEALVRYGVEIALALDAAHRRGVVHRDLKPGNVMLTKSGAKLLDFGLAKMAGPVVGGGAASGVTSAPTEARPLTGEGMIVGTMDYMAPEQIEGREPDARTDIFALGAMLHEMATGRRAFSGKSPASLIAAILTSNPPPVSSLQPVAPPALDRVVATCLNKDPDDRWQSARDVATQLRFVGSAQPAATAVSAAPTHGRERAAWTAAVLAAVLGPLLGFAIARQTKTHTPLPRYRFQLDAPAGTTFSQNLNIPAVSPDGERIVFAANDSTSTALYVRPLASEAATKLASTESAVAAFWSPDGRQVGFARAGSLQRAELAGGTAHKICDIQPGRFTGATWGASGIILYALNGDLYTAPAAGGDSQLLGKRAAGEKAREWPRFLPDGRHFLYTSKAERPEEAGVYVGSLDSAERKRLLASDANADYSRTGHLLFIRGDALMAQPFDGVSTLSGSPAPVVDKLAPIRLLGMAQFSVGGDGVIAWRKLAARNVELTWFDRSGVKAGTVGAPAIYTSPALSPDDTRLAVAIEEPDKQTRDLWVFDLVRGTKTRLTFEDADELNATWSPDGRRIAFTSDNGGPRDLYVKAADGSGADERLIPTSDYNRHAEHWSASGRFLLFNYWGGAKPVDIYMLPMSGTDRAPAPLLAGDFGEQQAQLSPDDRWLAYSSNESGPWEVYVRGFAPENKLAQGKWQISNGGGAEPRWRADGKELYYITDRSLMVVDVRTAASSFEAGIARRLFDVRDRVRVGSRNSFVVTRDGGKFLVTIPLDAREEPIDVLVNGLAPR